MGLLHEYLRKEIAELHAKGVRLSVIGDYRRLSPDLVSLIEHGMEMTRGNARLNLVLALNYGAQDEIVRSEEHTSELQSLMRISYAVFCLKKKNIDYLYN